MNLIIPQKLLVIPVRPKIMVKQDQDGQRDIQPFIEGWTRTVEGVENQGHLQDIGHHRGQKIRTLTNRQTNR